MSLKKPLAISICWKGMKFFVTKRQPFSEGDLHAIFRTHWEDLRYQGISINKARESTQSALARCITISGTDGNQRAHAGATLLLPEKYETRLDAPITS
jgi:hypothetical protein